MYQRHVVRSERKPPDGHLGTVVPFPVRLHYSFLRMPTLSFQHMRDFVRKHIAEYGNGQLPLMFENSIIEYVDANA
jgi:hypothetical protein